MTGASAVPSPVRRAVLLVNYEARRGNQALDGVVERLRAGGVTVEEAALDGPESVESAVAALGEVDAAIICGGDGSLCRAVPGVIAAGVTLGILPMGTANDLARTLAIPDDLDAATDIIIAGHRRRIDVGTVNGKPFFNVASMGLSTELARQLSPELKRRWGRLGYALAALKTLAGARRFAASITENGTTTGTRTMQIAVGNGRFYGGGTVIAERAAIDDGHLDLYSLEMRSVWKLALMLKSFRSGEHGAWSEVHTARGTAFEIRTSRPMKINADGELLAETPAVFEVHPGAVTVLAPLPQDQ